MHGKYQKREETLCMCMCLRVCASLCMCEYLTARRGEWLGLCEGGLFLASLSPSLSFFPCCRKETRSASGKRELAASNHLPAVRTHTYTHHSDSTSQRWATRAMATEQPQLEAKSLFPSIEGETESKMKGKKRAGERERGSERGGEECQGKQHGTGKKKKRAWWRSENE